MRCDLSHRIHNRDTPMNFALFVKIRTFVLFFVNVSCSKKCSYHTKVYTYR